MLRAISLTFLAALICVRSSAADVQRLSAADSVEIRTAAILATIDTLRAAESSTPIWIRVADDTIGLRSSTKRIESDVRRRFPRARIAPSQSELYQCPPGVELRMPGTSCPILENGIVVDVGTIRIIRNQPCLSVAVIRTQAHMTWAEGLVIYFARGKRGWKIKSVPESFTS